MKFLVLALTLCALAGEAANAHELSARNLDASVFGVLATNWHGTQLSGSAVAIAPSKLVTNCHVVRNARWIEVARGAERWNAEIHAGDGQKDLCILVASGLHAPAVARGSTSQLKPGDPVFAVSYGGGGKRLIGTGSVEALFRYGDARIIQTSARFDQGASGGALVTVSGELVGILTFKAPSGDAFHFALPVDWIAVVDDTSSTDANRLRPGVPFYEIDPQHRPHFLRAAWYQAARKWPEFFEICAHWVSSDPESDEARWSMMEAVRRVSGSHRSEAVDSK